MLVLEKSPIAVLYHADLNQYAQNTCTVFGIIRSSKIDMLNGRCIPLLAEHAKEELTHKSYRYHE
jgi:hypothetical protein